ncbi:hypothetical protein Hhel01_03576 [Haloferula helveola]
MHTWYAMNTKSATAQKKVSLNIRVTPELRSQLKQYADESQVTLEELATVVFERLLEKRWPIEKKVTLATV